MFDEYQADSTPDVVGAEQPAADAEQLPTYGDVARSMTGWDEIATRKQFGPSSDWDGPTSLRAMAFVLRRREQDTTDLDAFGEVMGMPLGDIHALFADTAAQKLEQECGGGKA